MKPIVGSGPCQDETDSSYTYAFFKGVSHPLKNPHVLTGILPVEGKKIPKPLANPTEKISTREIRDEQNLDTANRLLESRHLNSGKDGPK